MNFESQYKIVQEADREHRNAVLNQVIKKAEELKAEAAKDGKTDLENYLDTLIKETKLKQEAREKLGDGDMDNGPDSSLKEAVEYHNAIIIETSRKIKDEYPEVHQALQLENRKWLHAN